MTRENFLKAVAISNRINALQGFLDFHGKHDNILTYAYKNCNNNYTIHPSWATTPISHLLKKHDAMIRQEIEQEIEALEKEIEAL